MPYRWTEDSVEPRQTRLTLWPHRSLPRRGFAAFILGTFALITFPLIPLLGTAVLWGLLPFLLAALAGVWIALQRSYRDGQMQEVLTIDDTQVHLVRTEPRGTQLKWDCNRYWARVQIHAKGGPVDHYLTLSGSHRDVEIGAFLSEDERKSLFGELNQALRAQSA